MRYAFTAFAAVMVATLTGWQTKAGAGVALADLSWADAEAVLTASTLVVIPLGSGALEQGPHLKLDSEARLVRHLAARVQAASPVVVAPLLAYHSYPAYAEYPGTASLTTATARALTVDLVRSLARFGPRRFYVLNTQRETVAVLSDAARALADGGILLGYTDPGFRLRASPVQLRQAPISVAHADEVMTSMMLFVDPSAVDMTRATREYAAGSGALTRREGATGVFSRSGVLGDATQATRQKGEALVDTLFSGVLDDLESLRAAALPAVRATTPPPVAPRAAAGAEPAVMPTGCTAGQDRSIRLLGPAFSSAWREMDAVKIGQMFTGSADVRHPDGTIERTPDVIRQNRAELFGKKEYRGSIHPLQLNDIRCFNGTAIADGRWELRMLDGTKPFAGNCTLVLRDSGGWLIEAWRYTVDPAPNTIPAPTILKKPGWPGGPGGE